MHEEKPLGGYSVKWEDGKDEMYTTFGKCLSCNFNSVVAGSNYCQECGVKISNPYKF